MSLPAVLQRNLQPTVEEGLLTHAGMQNVIVIDRIVEHLGVRLEPDSGSRVLGLTYYVDLFHDISAGEAHLMDLAVLVNLDNKPFRQGVNHRSANAVQTARDFVSAAAELAAGMEHREDDLQRALSGLFLDIHRDASTVVRYADDVTRFDGYFDMGAVSCQRLVDGVVDNLVNKVMQA